MAIELKAPKKLISSYDNPDELRNIIDNAKRRNAESVAAEAFRRLCEVAATGNDELQRDFNRIMTAYEEVLRQKNHGKKFRATRVWRKVDDVGIEKVLTDWANSKEFQEGFSILIDLGMPELTGEALVIKYADKDIFLADTIENAKRRLKAAEKGDHRIK